jgi:hypothetical protein
LTIGKLAYNSTRASGSSQVEAAKTPKIRALFELIDLFTHHEESRATSASAAATRAAETKIDFMIAIL